jgi:hypothetical protein
MPTSVRRVTRLSTRFSAGRGRRYVSFRSTESSHGVCANAPEDRDFRGLGLLGFAVFPLVLRADQQSVHKNVIALMEGVSDRLAEAVESHDAVPLGFGLPLFVRVFPRLLGGDGQDGEVRTVAADLPFLRIFSEEADELNVIQIHFVSPFLPHFLGAPKGGVDTAPKASGCILGGTRRLTGRNRESRSREAAGRRNYPEAVPKEKGCEKETLYT